MTSANCLMDSKAVILMNGLMVSGTHDIEGLAVEPTGLPRSAISHLSLKLFLDKLGSPSLKGHALGL